MLQTTLLLSIIVLINSQPQQPLLTRFSIPIRNIDDQFNTDIQRLISKIFTNFELGAFTVPRIIQIYKIQTPFDHSQTIHKIISDPQYQCPSLLQQFNKQKYSFSSLFINYEDQQIMQLFQQEYSKQNLLIKIINHSIDQITFSEDHSNSLKRVEPVIETISVPLKSIQHLDQQLEKDINSLNQQQKPFVIFITFIKDNYIFQDYQFSERMLKQDYESMPTEPIGIDGNTLSAYLISLMLLLILFIGGCCLVGIQTPMKFQKTHFIIGREN